MRSQIERNKEILLEEIRRVGSGRMGDAAASRLAAYRGAYKSLCLACDPEEEWEDSREEKADTHHGTSRHVDKLTREDISHWVDGMENEDGTRGPHYTKDQVEQYRRSLSIDCDLMELYAATNMMYSDYCRVLKKYGADRPEVYVELARAFLDDKDAGAKNKLAAYYEAIVEGE